MTAGGFVFPGCLSSRGGEVEEKLTPEEMVPLGAFVMQVFVKDLMGETHCLEVDRCESIVLVKRKIYTKMCIKSSLQRLMYGGKQLDYKFDLS